MSVCNTDSESVSSTSFNFRMNFTLTYLLLQPPPQVDYDAIVNSLDKRYLDPKYDPVAEMVVSVRTHTARSCFTDEVDVLGQRLADLDRITSICAAEHASS